MDLKGFEGDPEYKSFILDTYQKLLLVTICDPTAETGVSFWTDGRRTDGWTEEQTDLEVEVVI